MRLDAIQKRIERGDKVRFSSELVEELAFNERIKISMEKDRKW